MGKLHYSPIPSAPDATMKQKNWIGLGYLACLTVTCLGLVTSPPLSAQEPKLQTTLKGHTHNINSVAFSPDGKTLASGSADWTIKLWDVAGGKEKATLK